MTDKPLLLLLQDPNPKAVQFAKGYIALVESTGYLIESCGCCPPGLTNDSDSRAHDAMGTEEIKEELTYLCLQDVIDHEPPRAPYEDRLAAAEKKVKELGL